MCVYRIVFRKIKKEILYIPTKKFSTRVAFLLGNNG